MKHFVYIIITTIVAVTSFCCGRYYYIEGQTVYKDGSVSKTITVHHISYKEENEWLREHNNALMDIIEDIYVEDSVYFDKLMKRDSYIKLQKIYNDDNISWDEIYNL